jgi:hypothetical protein
VLVTIVHKKDGFGSGRLVRYDLSSRWLVYQRPPLIWWPGRMGLPLKRETEAMRVNWASEYDEAYSLINDPRYFTSLRGSEEFATLERDLTELKAKALDHTGKIWVPAPTSEYSGKTGKTSFNKTEKKAPNPVEDKGDLLPPLPKSGPAINGKN